MGILQAIQALLGKATKLVGGVGYSTDASYTGYKTVRSYITLLSASFEGVNNSEFLPVVNADKSMITHCNQFVTSVATKMGCKGFEGRTANEMIDFIRQSPDWTSIPMEKAQWLASVGSLIIAAQREEPHGHVNVIIPGTEVRSIHWSCTVPVCANVGKDNFVGKGVNWAFREIPEFYAWRPSL